MLASANALGIAAATIAAGPIYRAAGPAVFVAMAPLGAIGFGLALVALRRSRAQPQSSGEGGETTLPR
jgi:MFS transporter, PPP family, 3-phenylpropionic acid transporter